MTSPASRFLRHPASLALAASLFILSARPDAGARADTKVSVCNKSVSTASTKLVCPVNMFDSDLGELGRLVKLRSLELGGSELTDAGLAKLAKLTSLRRLVLYRNYDITDAGIAHLSRLAGLRQLSIGYAYEVTDKAIPHLNRLRSLRSLDVAWTAITDKGLAKLRAPNLRSLDIANSRVTDGGVAGLARFSNLRRLRLKGIRVSAATIATLRRALPRCKIITR